MTHDEMMKIMRETFRVKGPDFLLTGNALYELLIWEKVGKITVPEFIEGRAKGYMKMKNGKIYRKRIHEPTINRS
jgi:hypothetical protein